MANQNDIEGGEGRNTIMARGKSSITLMTMHDAAATICAKEDPIVTKLVNEAVNGLDEDGDGNINGTEVVVQLVRSIKEAMLLNTERDVAQEQRDVAAAESRKWRKRSLGLAVCTVGLFIGFFGVVIAAVTLTKDSKVASNSRALFGDESGSRAFMSKDNHPIATNTNQAEFPFAASAFLPEDTRMKISDIAMTGPEGQDYHRRVMSLDIVPKQSILLRTLDGDTITWSLFANGGQSIFVELKDGTSFKKCAMCTPCISTNVVADDSLFDAVDEFYDSVGFNDMERDLTLYSNGTSTTGGFNTFSVNPCSQDYFDYVECQKWKKKRQQQQQAA